jgi:Cu/Ag efflux pump CusA
MFTHLSPHIFFGGDNVKFWGPLSWTMIFGIIFGTFLTLIFVPVMYLLRVRLKATVKSWFSQKEVASESEHLALDK